MLLRYILLFFISLPLYAIDDGKPETDEESQNFCLNKQSAIDNENLARNNPYDDLLIKVVALRAGLCDLIDKEIIDLDFAIDLFNNEYGRAFMKRIQEEQNSNREIDV